MVHYPQVDELTRALRRVMRGRAYSPRTMATYESWVLRFLRYHRALRAELLGPREVQAFLDHLANERRLSASSTNLAASALAFLYHDVLGSEALGEVRRARASRRVPVVLSDAEARQVLDQMDGVHRLVACLLYGTGVRLAEALGLRIKDVDFDLAQLVVRDGKGRKDRTVPMPEVLRPNLRAQERRVRRLHERDLERESGWAALPGALHRKDPRAGYAPAWQFLFPASKSSRDAATGRRGRHHLHPTAVQRRVKAAVRDSGITKRASCHTFRHTYATEMLRSGIDVRTLQRLLGHKDLRTTSRYLHVVDDQAPFVVSPLDRPRRPTRRD